MLAQKEQLEKEAQELRQTTEKQGEPCKLNENASIVLIKRPTSNQRQKKRAIPDTQQALLPKKRGPKGKSKATIAQSQPVKKSAKPEKKPKIETKRANKRQGKAVKKIFEIEKISRSHSS